MTTFARWRLLIALLVGVALVQAGLLVHMAMGPDNIYPTAPRPLSELPMTFSSPSTKDRPQTVWSFQTLSDEGEVRRHLPFEPLDMIFRYGRSPDFNADVELYAVHSAQGEDRRHHPEICVREVQQTPIDPSGQALIHLDGDPKRPVQRFAFIVSPTRTFVVYYWHYTFDARPQSGQSWLQSLYSGFNRPPPSFTIQVTTAARRDRWADVERTLLSPLDRTLRSQFLPEGVTMNCDRLPIGLVTK